MQVYFVEYASNFIIVSFFLVIMIWQKKSFTVAVSLSYNANICVEENFIWVRPCCFKMGHWNRNKSIFYLLRYILDLKFSKRRPSGPMLSISRNVRLCVCLSVCLFVCSLLRYRLTVFLHPFPEVGCLEIWNPWGKVMERSGLTFEHFCFEMV